MSRRLFRPSDLITLFVLCFAGAVFGRLVAPEAGVLVTVGSILVIGTWELRQRLRQARRGESTHMELMRELEHAQRLEALKRARD